MTVTLELGPEVENRVTSKAKVLGKSVETFLLDVIDKNVSAEPSELSFFETATDAEWEAAMDSIAEFSEELPDTWDDSRESIYR